jgi:xanthine dehydrogenase small subunit
VPSRYPPGMRPDPSAPDPAPGIAFTLNGRPVSLPPGTEPTQTLLDWLRGPAGLPGTKEGCAEGDCGACTVVLERPDGSRTPVNACLMLLGQAHGRAIRTVEGLRGPDGGPHSLQRLLAEADATQCGFCTPGIVMSAWAHAREGGEVHEALAGNLCRCTGYRPILDAFAQLTDDGPPAPAPPASPAAPARFAAPGQVFHLPASLAELLALRAAQPEAWLLAGGTDLGLRVSEGRERPGAVICLQGVPELAGVEAKQEGLRVGAAVPYATLLRLSRREADFAPFGALLARLGSRQIRGLGTLGGNLGTASPIGDALPPLLALGATLRLASLRGRRELPAAAFLLGYRQTALAPDEVIENIWLPRPPADAIFACEKLSKRHDQDIATVGAAFLLRLAEGRVAEARLAFGGMGPLVARARRAEAALLGAPWSEAAVERAAAALAEDFTPLSDWRGSAEYRRLAAANLLRRLWWRGARPDLPLEVTALEAPGA